MTKEGYIRNPVLFGKYRLLRELGTGRSGTVWLAVHLGLQEYRAIKCVPRQQLDQESFRSEALILKELHHPGIPMIYDLEEDSEYFYLIEEYLEGCSLYTLIIRQGPMKEAEAVNYGIQLCGLVEYMHSACEIPILHLDLQPNNLILCNGVLKLIDFDHAAGSLAANASSKRYGTVGCAAPEQYTSDQKLDQRTDVYAIGAVLRFMITGTLREGKTAAPAPSKALGRIIETCMETDMDKRYSSARETGEELGGLCAQKQGCGKENKAIPSHIVILAAMKPGSGATHLGFGLASFLNQQGYKVLYEEHNPSQAVRTLASASSMRPDQFGIYTMHGGCFKPWYGPAVDLEEAEGFDVVVRDYGTQWEQAAQGMKEETACLLAAGSASPWDLRSVSRFGGWLEGMGAGLEDKGCCFILKGSQKNCREALRALEKAGKGKVKGDSFVFLQYEDPFQLQKKERSFFEAVWISLSGMKGDQRRSWWGKWDFLRKIR